MTAPTSTRQRPRPIEFDAAIPGMQPRAVEARDWYRIENKADDEDTAEIYIYDEIGYWGTTAADFVNELREITASNIDLHLNTPGGRVFDGIAIYNALVRHSATVTVYVDAIAASAGSFIAQAGDRRVMGNYSQLMIHEAHGLAIGFADDMRQMADLLDRLSGNIAAIYNDRANGGDASTLAGWREAMKAETWYSAEEAVEAGLADEVAALPAREDGDDEDEPQDRASAWDLSVFTYAGRDKAPAPKPITPSAPAAATDTPSADPGDPESPPSGLHIPSVRFALKRHLSGV